MLRRELLLGLSTLAAGWALADEKRGKSCCEGKDKRPAPEAGAEKRRCTLTGKEVDGCCCEMRDGKLHCTLADRDVESCCCVPVDGEA